MNLLKLIIGIALVALVPTHWFIGGVTLTALGGFPGILIAILWIGLFIFGVKLILEGISGN